METLDTLFVCLLHYGTETTLILNHPSIVLNYRESFSYNSLRFGPGTWQSILDERQKRIAEAKEAERLARIKKRQEEEEFWEMIKMVMIIAACTIIGGGGLIYVVYSAV